MTRPRVVASVEARMGSSRLPGKILMDIAGRPALSRLVDRLRAVPNLDAIVVATTTNSLDDVVATWAVDAGVACWRGSEDDVLSRVVDAQKSMASDIVVEITGDCPLVCPDVVELAIETYHANSADVVANVLQPVSYPQGTDVQVYALAKLAHVAATVSDPAVREHVSLYFYEHPESYRLINLVAPREHRMPDVRLQLDYDEDLECIRTIYARLLPDHGGLFGLGSIVDLLRREPAIPAINANCVEKSAR